MNYKVVWIEGGKTIICAYHACKRVKMGIVWQQRFTRDALSVHDVLLFCQQSCCDAHYREYPMFVQKKKDNV